MDPVTRYRVTARSAVTGSEEDSLPYLRSPESIAESYFYITSTGRAAQTTLKLIWTVAESKADNLLQIPEFG